MVSLSPQIAAPPPAGADSKPEASAPTPGFDPAEAAREMHRQFRQMIDRRRIQPQPDEQAGRRVARLVVEHGPVEPRAVPAAAAFRMIGVGETTGWKLIREGRLEAVKIGRSTVVTIEAIDNFLATAPRRVPDANSSDRT